MEPAVNCEPCEVAEEADEAVPFGWCCANCGAEAASKRRGPNKEFCSKGPCRRLDSLASVAVKDDANLQRIATLEGKVREQATTITLLKNQLTQAQAALERAKACAVAMQQLGPGWLRPCAMEAGAPARSSPVE